MLVFDAHCDTISKILDTKQDLHANHCHIDLERMHWSYDHVQFFAAFVDPVFGAAYAMKRAICIIDKFYEQLALYSDLITLCLTAEDVRQAVKKHKTAALLSIEGGEALQGELASLRVFHKLGVRSLCLTWNRRNEIADGITDAASRGGLTTFGRKVVQEMNRLGMLVDVSHIAEEGFWDVLEESSQPIIASHSNARSVCNHPRNLTNEQLHAIQRNQGVIGVNFYPWHLTGKETALCEDVIRHIEYIASVAGEDHIGIGADFDGIEVHPADLEGVQHMDRVFNGLLMRNYSEGFIRKLAGENFMRMLEQVLQ